MVKLLCEGLNRRDDVVASALVCNEGLSTRSDMVDGVEVTRVASLGRVWSEPLAPTFPLRLLRSMADIYHFHSPFPLGEIAALKMSKRAPMVTWYHSDVVRQRFFLRAYRRLMSEFLARNRAILVSSPNLVATSPVLREFWSSCRVVHFGIDTRRFELNASIQKRAGEIREESASDAPLVLFVGRLVYYKGLECLIEAMCSVDAHIMVIGKGPLEKRLRRLAEEKGVSGRLHLVSWVRDEEMPAYYHACDMLVLPSTARSEAFGLVLLEAQACGKPTVSTELGTGTSYANLDGVTGFVVPPGDAGALAAAIKRLVRDRALREEMGRRARERVLAEFNLEQMADRVADIYNEIIYGR
ncbi:MAG: glycosyltransferase [Actinobacteria bacterium]|nr:glycosyltransferase [Actinomycetota bacterium]